MERNTKKKVRGKKSDFDVFSSNVFVSQKPIFGIEVEIVKNTSF